MKIPAPPLVEPPSKEELLAAKIVRLQFLNSAKQKAVFADSHGNWKASSSHLKNPTAESNGCLLKAEAEIKQQELEAEILRKEKIVGSKEWVAAKKRQKPVGKAAQARAARLAQFKLEHADDSDSDGEESDGASAPAPAPAPVVVPVRETKKLTPAEMIRRYNHGTYDGSPLMKDWVSVRQYHQNLPSGIHELDAGWVQQYARNNGVPALSEYVHDRHHAAHSAPKKNADWDPRFDKNYDGSPLVKHWKSLPTGKAVVPSKDHKENSEWIREYGKRNGIKSLETYHGKK